MSNTRNSEVTRRELLRRTAYGAAATGVGALPPGTLGAEKTPAATQKTSLPTGVLGRTKYPVTLISYGAILAKERLGTRVSQRAIDIGINLLHTSMSYTGGGSVAAVGELFKKDKTYRGKVLLCLKSFTPEKESEIDDMLTKLGTDHADLLLPTMHEADSKRLELIQNSLDQLKKKGKIRFRGFVCHQDMNGVMEMVLAKAPEYFDAALMAMKMLDAAGKPKEGAAGEKGRQFLKNLQALKRKGVGIMSMKSGARTIVKEGSKAFQPHVKALLKAGADTVLTSIDAFEQIEMIKNLDLKSPTTTPAELRAAAEFNGSQANACLMCGDCSRACPRSVPVADLMRIRMYYEEYGWHDHAQAEFAALQANVGPLAGLCIDCSACTQVCPVGLARARTINDVISHFT